MIPVGFEELQQPWHLPPFGWYVAGVRYADEDAQIGWYLHDDRVVRDYCQNDKFPTSGWYSTLEDAWQSATDYYKQFNETYPYALCTNDDGSQYCARISDRMIELVRKEFVVESEVMEFI